MSRSEQEQEDRLSTRELSYTTSMRSFSLSSGLCVPMQGLAHEDACGSHVHGYRWKKFGMPLRIFNDKHFLLQPLLVMSQVGLCGHVPCTHLHTQAHHHIPGIPSASPSEGSLPKHPSYTYTH